MDDAVTNPHFGISGVLSTIDIVVVTRACVPKGSRTNNTSSRSAPPGGWCRCVCLPTHWYRTALPFVCSLSACGVECCSCAPVHLHECGTTAVCVCAPLCRSVCVGAVAVALCGVLCVTLPHTPPSLDLSVDAHLPSSVDHRPPRTPSTRTPRSPTIAFGYTGLAAQPTHSRRSPMVQLCTTLLSGGRNL